MNYIYLVNRTDGVEYFGFVSAVLVCENKKEATEIALQELSGFDKSKCLILEIGLAYSGQKKGVLIEEYLG